MKCGLKMIAIVGVKLVGVIEEGNVCVWPWTRKAKQREGGGEVMGWVVRSYIAQGRKGWFDIFIQIYIIFCLNNVVYYICGA